MEKILVVAAHPDDEILGCAGTLKRLINEGNEVYSLILSDGTTSRYDRLTEQVSTDIKRRLEQNQSAAKVIGYKETFFCQFPDNSFDKESLLAIVKAIEKYILLLKPSVIYTHHYGDLNIDHQKTFHAVQTAARPMLDCSVKEIYSFETLSATDWNFTCNAGFTPNYFVNIEGTMKDKLEAMKCYKSELREYPHPRSLEGLKIAAKKWGMTIGCNYAEAFELIRKIVL